MTIFTNDEFRKIANSYLTAMLWAESPYNWPDEIDSVCTDSCATYEDMGFTLDDCTSYCVQMAEQEVRNFVSECNHFGLFETELKNYSLEEIGINLWLSSQGHGAGFFDKGATKAQELSKYYGLDHFINDNRKIGCN